MLGQIGARAVLGGAHQILHILLLGNHDRKMLSFALKRKSWQLKNSASLMSCCIAILPSSLA